MDYAASSSTSSAIPVVPPIPRQSRHQSRRKTAQDPSLQVDIRGHDSHRRVQLQPASPEIISSLITSLSDISKPASLLFEQPSLSVPASPGRGSFGVDYGAFSSSLRDLHQGLSLDELAASPPTIRTAKPPSGFSPLTAPKSPKSPQRDASSSGGLRSLLRSSRPSSRGSATSSHDDTRSIGNLSVERGMPPTHELRGQQSHDSWGRKSGRNHKGLMYMSSKERLRCTEAERKRTSVGSIGGSAHAGNTSSSASRPDPFLAETPISEEPMNFEFPLKEKLPDRSPSFDLNNIQRSIPMRDSSLRKTGPNAKRSSHRSTRSKRDSEAGFNDSIPENEEHHRSRDDSTPQQRQQVRTGSEADTRTRREEILQIDMPNHPNTSASTYRHTPDGSAVDETTAASDVEDGAPFPSIYLGRRRSSAQNNDKKKPGRLTPDTAEMLKTKRSNSRLKRLSQGAKSPGPDDSRATSPEPHVSYERPPSADSIDDAVASYLCSPRLSQKIRHPQTGRVISFSEVGDPEGSAVFCCVGMGLTRYIMGFYDELALTLKLRLITPDRPGVGDSESYTDGTATPLSWPDDVYAICQSLKITKFSILAHSAGAIYALATALRMPQHIRGRIHLLAPWIPPSQMNVFGTSQAMPPTNAIPTSQRILRALPTTFLKAANSSFMSATSSSITSSLPKSKDARRGKRKSTATTAGQNRRDTAPGVDKENMAQPHDPLDHGDGKHSSPIATENMDQIRPVSPGKFNSPQNAVLDAAADAITDKERQTTYDLRLTHAIWDLATTGANPAVDLLVCLERRHTIGFRYVDITRPVVIHHGSRDTRVPVENVKWLGKTMRRCEVRVLEGEGHGLMASANVMGSVLMEISKEWEDWMRVTGTSGREGERERGRSLRAGVR
ncbi:uncharacterized protein BCR38DRAFT_486673 [Pseudomassariella vexata]|uniref:AB hydrolase-1 domain-containing protein n=1 Tax=Pseudomassariella vexata TaxID=1141098 RepID=A0A1Y2DT14_9PEZI|nr:uncharacterized protein BCR38DRAFT_486673 [Pseudomassariella vexata]ORY62418.1 hypothetical protein BCR38DRAFT_486673 [Pseudomassariella vexata]